VIDAEPRRGAPGGVLSAVVSTVGVGATLWGFLIAWAGGAQVHVLGMKLSSRHPFLLMAGGLGVLAIYAWIWRPEVGRRMSMLATPSRRVASTAAAVLAVLVLAVSVHWASAIAGGADSYGYVSEAGLWRNGDLLVRGDIIRQSPWPLAIDTWAPLGYRPAPGRNDAIAPMYPPGFPLLMALFQLVFGYCGAFYVVPVCSAATVLLTFTLGMRVFGRPAPALWASLLMATSPVFLYQAIQPMTDVPTTAAWALVLLLVAADRPLSAGLAMAVALAIRPNLVLVAAVVMAWTAFVDWKHWRTGGQRPSRTLRLGIGVLPVVVGIGWLNAHLYGSPLESGYGSLDYIYSRSHVWANVTRFTKWMVATQTPIVFASALFFVLPSAYRNQRIDFPRVLLGGTLLAVVASYLFYTPFEAWSYLRFLLPMWPVMMLLTAVLLDGIVQRWPSTTSRLSVLAVLALVAWWGVRTARENYTSDLWRGERRFVDVGRYIGAHTEPRAVIVTFQHSGSVRHYAGRLTLRWDTLGEGWLDRAIAYLAETGRHPYILVDAEETEPFRQRFQGSNRAGALDWTPIAVLDSQRTLLYDAVDRSARRSEIMPGTSTGEAMWRCDPPYRWPTPVTLEEP
jgi:hypothetical protein